MLARSGVVTKLRRGLYGLSDGKAPAQVCAKATDADNDQADCDMGDCDTARAPVVTPEERPSPHSVEQIERAIAAAWTDFEAMNDPHDQRAWA